MTAYLILTILLAGAPPVSMRFIVVQGPEACTKMVTSMILEPPPALLGGYVVTDYYAGCQLRRAPPAPATPRPAPAPAPEGQRT